MSTAKEEIKKILDLQPEDSSYDEILKELTFKRMVDTGLDDINKGNIFSNKEMHSRIQSWRS